jgi:CDP-6-deoxy-D-xylo-4-hexulose-3-dehydrase
MEPILCECDRETLGIDIDHLRELVNRHKPSVLMIVHVLAFPNKMDEIVKICQENDIILLEDSCESIGSTYKGKKTGNFGLMSSFSFYYGHHMSTIEGGMICTDDLEIYRLLVSIRSHGWDRDLDIEHQKNLRIENNVDDFRALYTFYYPGFNLRSTDLQAFLGIQQLEKIDLFSEIRNRNFEIYHKNIKNDFWKIEKVENCFYSNFAYPIIHPNIKSVVEELRLKRIECRPLVCGSIGLQPYWKNLYGVQNFDFGDIVHNFGLYLPNNQDIKEEEIIKICEIINQYTND